MEGGGRLPVHAGLRLERGAEDTRVRPALSLWWPTGRAGQLRHRYVSPSYGPTSSSRFSGVLGQFQPAHLQLVALGDEFAEARRRAPRPSRSRWRSPRSACAAWSPGSRACRAAAPPSGGSFFAARASWAETAGAAAGAPDERGAGAAEGVASSSMRCLRSRYSSMPRGSIRRARSPRRAMTLSVVRSMKNRSWEITIIDPGQLSRRSSSWVRVSMSRSLVGSSRKRTLGSSISSRRIWRRRRSPPERSPTGVHCFSLVKPNCSQSWPAVISRPLPRSTRSRTCWTASRTRRFGLSR